MPWKVKSLMSARKEFIWLAKSDSTNVAELCRRFGISRKTAYKWINRFFLQGEAGLSDLSRKPDNSPNITPPEIEELVLEIRKLHPAWGGRKIRKVLPETLSKVPAASTISAILKRKGYVDPQESLKHKQWQFFEAAAPNDMWQIDFKGHFEIVGRRCHPLTVLDDHSRYSLCVKAFENETRMNVQSALTNTFRTFGLPRAILCDNGPPWGGDPNSNHTRLGVWLMRLGIRMPWSRPYHPQTRGKIERFHRTLKAEVLQFCGSLDLDQCQDRFDQWRVSYNTQRPHEALGLAVPASRYQVSSRPFPENMPPIEYDSSDHVRKVQHGGWINFLGREFRIGKAFHGERVAIRPTLVDGVFDVYFCDHEISRINLGEPHENSS